MSIASTAHNRAEPFYPVVLVVGVVILMAAALTRHGAEAHVLGRMANHIVNRRHVIGLAIVGARHGTEARVTGLEPAAGSQA